MSTSLPTPTQPTTNETTTSSSSNNEAQEHNQANHQAEENEESPILIGSPSKNFWLYHPSTSTFNLTHPSTPSSPPIPSPLHLNTTTNPIILDPTKTALLIIDMQNFFLSSLLSPSLGPGHLAADNLVRDAIPACRAAGIQIIYLNWGLTPQDLESMPPSAIRAFGFDKGKRDRYGQLLPEGGRGKYVGLGNPLGILKDPETGEKVDAGKMLMQNQWNTALYPPLQTLYDQGKTLPNKPDKWIHKTRMSGLWGSGSACQEFLQSQGIKTLLFAGVNTDQCVGGTMQDAWSLGFDCILVRDGTGTSSPGFAQECWEWNAGRSLGFVVDCRGLREGVEGMGLNSPEGLS